MLLIALAFGAFAISIPESVRQLADTPEAAQLSGGTLGITGTTYGIFINVLDVLTALAFLAVGGLLLLRRSHDWYVLFIFLTLGLTAVNYSKAYYAYYVRFWPPSAVSLMLGALAAFAEICQLAAFFTFPNGKFTPRWTRWLLALWVPYRIFGWMYWYMQPVEIRVPTRPYDLGVQFLIFFIGIVAQAVRYRRATDPVQKQQTKWIAFVMSVATLVLLANALFDALPMFQGGVSRVAFVVTGAILIRITLILIPIAVAASVLRYRLWDIDFIINRSLVYGALTALLGALFLGSAVIVAQVFDTMSGGFQSALSLAVAGLIFGVLFQPARRRLQSFVDRRLYHIEINYRRKAAPVLPVRGMFSGKTLGKYELLEPVGRGGMAEVYRAQHTSLNREAAVKVLAPAMSDDHEWQKRFEREAQLIGRLKHPNIVQLFDYGTAEGTPYMAMEFVNGRNLSDMIKTSGALSVKETMWMIRDVAKALDYAHGEGLIHRDIKPSNIMIEPVTSPGDHPFRAVLMDFGVARIANSLTLNTKAGIVGTLDYISPEQIKDDPNLDGRADLYSLGVMLFQMLTGRLPFTASNPGALLLAHLNQPAPDPRDFQSALSEAAAYAVLRALEKKPDLRFHTAGELAAAISA